MGVVRIPLAHQLKLVADNMPAEAGKNREATSVVTITNLNGL
jgi:hypothetical protein